MGRLRHVTITRTAPFNADPMGRPWNWWFQAGTGGGILGAMASHYIDQMRWWIGEIRAVQGRLSTMVPQRRLPDNSGMRAVETDDACSFMFEFAGGGEGTVILSTVAHHPQGYRAEIFGDEGSLILDAQERLWGAKRGEKQLTEFTQPDPAAGLPGIEQTIWARSFVHLVDHVAGAVAAGGRPSQGGDLRGWPALPAGHGCDPRLVGPAPLGGRGRLSAGAMSVPGAAAGVERSVGAVPETCCSLPRGHEFRT